MNLHPSHLDDAEKYKWPLVRAPGYQGERNEVSGLQRVIGTAMGILP